jgi:hypothetical protein
MGVVITALNLCVGAGRCAGPRVSVRKWDLLMPVLRLPGGCIAFVPISPDVTKIPFGTRFGSTDASH